MLVGVSFGKVFEQSVPRRKHLLWHIVRVLWRIIWVDYSLKAGVKLMDDDPEM